MTTSSITLSQIANKLFTEEEFLGVFASDTLPKGVGPYHNMRLIVNTDTKNLMGTHWIAILSREDEAYYFDPFGYPPPLNIASWMNKYYSTWTYNSRQVQAITSDYCGYFCLHFLFISKLPYFNTIVLNRIIDHVYPKPMYFNFYQSLIEEFITSQNLNE